MRTVSRFEANLLTLLYFFLGREPAERGLPLVETRLQRPRCLSRTAVSLARQALAKGCVHILATRGGWQRQRFLRDGKIADGRLWQRTPPAELALVFSRFSLDFLIWITAARPGDREPALSVDPDSLTPGDRLLLYLAHQKLRHSTGGPEASQLGLGRPFVEHGLCRLAYPEDFTVAPPAAAPQLTPWTNGVGAAILEALQPELEERWVKVEATKENIADPERMAALGRTQETVLSAFLDAVEAANRFDLARFLLAAARRLLDTRARAEMWTGSLQTARLRVADRANAHRLAFAFLRQLERLRNWEIRMRSVGYFDEGYASAQLWKAEWARHDGEVLFQRASAIIRELEPMRARPATSGERSAE
jgi:hypothetical protein